MIVSNRIYQIPFNMEVLSKEDTLRAITEATAPLVHDLAVANRILAKIPLRVSTLQAVEMTGLSRYNLEKHFTKLQDGDKGRIYYSLVEIERWIAERELKAA